jgi:hypothetical protein
MALDAHHDPSPRIRRFARIGLKLAEPEVTR